MIYAVLIKYHTIQVIFTFNLLIRTTFIFTLENSLSRSSRLSFKVFVFCYLPKIAGF